MRSAWHKFELVEMKQAAVQRYVTRGMTQVGALFMSELNPNEMRLLRNLCLTDEEYDAIALRLQSNPRAVATAAWRIMNKADVHSRHSLTLFVWRNRVLQPAQEVTE